MRKLSIRMLAIPLTTENAGNTTHYRECWQYHSLQRMLAIPLTTENSGNTTHYRECWQYHTLQRMLAIPLTTENAGNTTHYRECWQYHSLCTALVQMLNNSRMEQCWKYICPNSTVYVAHEVTNNEHNDRGTFITYHIDHSDNERE